MVLFVGGKVGNSLGEHGRVSRKNVIKSNREAAIRDNLVFHDSALVKKARENTLGFLFLNYFLDCFISDQRDACDL